MKRWIWCAALLLNVVTVIASTPVSADKPFELQAPDGGELDSVVASVNGQPISLSDVLPESRSGEFGLYASLSGKALYKAILAARRKALDDIIDRRLLVEEYERAPFEIPTQYVESMLDDLAVNAGIRSRNEFAAKVRESGTTLEKLRREVRDRLVVQAMTTRWTGVVVSVSPREVFEYFKAHPEEFGKPETWNLALILIPAKRSDRAEVTGKIAAELTKDPNRFAALAAEYSSGPNAVGGGDLGLTPRNRLRPEFAAAIAEPVPGRVYGPVAGSEGDFFLRLLKVEKPETSDFRKLEPQIRTRLENERKREAVKGYLEKLRENAIIRYYL